MASCESFQKHLLASSLPFLLLLLLQVSPTVLSMSPLGEIHPSKAIHDIEDTILTFKPSKETDFVIIDVENITKALWNDGYKIMSMILKHNIRSAVPFSYRASQTEGNVIAININNTVTLFAPPDEAVRLLSWNKLQYQVALSKVDEESFLSGKVSEGSMLLTCDPFDIYLQVTEAPLGDYPSINDVKIVKWNIYNDGHIIVHGAEDFFNPRFRREFFKIRLEAFSSGGYHGH